MMYRLEQVQLQHRLRDIDLEISPGITAIMGPSGAGKTSLLNVLTGFEKPDAGSCTSASDNFFWVPQDAGLWPHLTVTQHLQAVSEETPDRWLEKFDLTDISDARPDTLSLGEKSRLSIARALAAKPEVLIMDEPLVHVDPAREPLYWAHILAAATHLIYSTHVAEKVIGTAERVVCLHAGRLLHAGEVEPLYYQPETEQLANYLGPCNWSERPALRPEQLSVQADDSGEWQVKNAIFRGSVQQLELEHMHDQKTKTLLHRPARATLQPGDRVRISPLV